MGESNKTISRRTVVAGIGLVGGAAALGVFVRGERTAVDPWAQVSNNERAAITRLVAKLPGVTIAPEAQVAWLLAYRTIKGRAFAMPKKSGKIARVLLKSTDFFQTGMDPERPAQFVAYYGPYVSPCYSPFRPS